MLMQLFFLANYVNATWFRICERVRLDRSSVLLHLVKETVKV